MVTMYKHTLYYINTTYGCAGVVVNQGGIVSETAPLYRWMKGKQFRVVLESLKWQRKLINSKKVLEEFEPF